MERKVKAVCISPEEMLHLFMEPKITRFHYRYAGFVGAEIKGADVVAVDWDITRQSFRLLLTRDDWPEVPMGQIIETLPVKYTVVGVELSNAPKP